MTPLEFIGAIAIGAVLVLVALFAAGLIEIEVNDKETDQ